MKRVKNTGPDPIVRCSQTLTPGAYYTIESFELLAWQNSSQVVTDIASGLLVMNDGNADVTDVSKAVDLLKDVVGALSLKPFADADGFRARFKGVKGTVTAGTTTNLDHVLTEERWIDGVEITHVGGAPGDTVNFQIVHPIAGVLDQFGETWNIDSTAGKQGAVVLSYPAKIPAGLTIRCAYTSVGETNVWIGVNLRLHKKT